jgi:hypothetical protein
MCFWHTALDNKTSIKIMCLYETIPKLKFKVVEVTSGHFLYKRHHTAIKCTALLLHTCEDPHSNHSQEHNYPDKLFIWLLSVPPKCQAIQLKLQASRNKSPIYHKIYLLGRNAVQSSSSSMTFLQILANFYWPTRHQHIPEDSTARTCITSESVFFTTP